MENCFVEARAIKKCAHRNYFKFGTTASVGLFLIGIALPSARGYIGVYQMAVVWAFSIYEVPTVLAVIVTTVFQLGIIMLVAASMSLIYYFQAIHHKFSSCLE